MSRTAALLAARARIAPGASAALAILAVLAAGALAPGGAQAQTAGRDPGRSSSGDTPPILAAKAGAPASARAGGGTATARVARRVAERWGVDAAVVRVVWEGAPLPASADVRLLGTGAGGSFVATAATDAGAARRRIRAGVRLAWPVASRDLERGRTLTAADMVVRDTLLWGPPPRTATAEAGWVTRRRLNAGALLVPPAVGAPAAVVAGSTVRLVWQSGRVQVTTRATAAGTAAVGERVAVRTAAGRRVWGIAESQGTVRVGGTER